MLHQRQAHLLLQLPLGAFQVFYQQVLPSELLVVGEVVDALPVVQVQLVQLGVDPAAGQEWVGGQHSAATGEGLLHCAWSQQRAASRVLHGGRWL